MARSEKPEPRQFEVPAGDWLYKYADEVYGPVPAGEIIERMFAGEVDEATPLSLGDGQWTSIGKVGAFQPFLYQAKAHLRALQARREAEAAARRRRRRRQLQVALVAVVLVLAGFAVSYLFIVYEPWRADSAIGAWAAKHPPLLAVVALGAAPAEENGDDELAGINIERILIDDAPALVAISPGGRQRPAAKAGRRPKNGSGRGTAKAGTAASTTPARPPKSTASLGALSNEEITQVVYSRGNLRRLYGCLRAEIKRNPDLPNEVIMEFSIANDGRVSQVRMDDTRLEGGALHRCFQQKLSRLRFRSFSGQVRNVTMPFKIGS